MRRCKECGAHTLNRKYKGRARLCEDCESAMLSDDWRDELAARCWPDEAIDYGLTSEERVAIREAAELFGRWSDYASRRRGGIEAERPEETPTDLLRRTAPDWRRCTTLMSRTIQYAIEHGLYVGGAYDSDYQERYREEDAA